MGKFEARGPPEVTSEYNYKGVRLSRQLNTVTIEFLDGNYRSYRQRGRRIVNRGLWKDARDEDRYYEKGAFKWRSLNGIIIPFDVNDDNMAFVFKMVLDDICDIAGVHQVTFQQVMQLIQKLVAHSVVSVSYTSGAPSITVGEVEFQRAMNYANNGNSNKDSCTIGAQ